jgi:hypothetical protein
MASVTHGMLSQAMHCVGQGPPGSVNDLFWQCEHVSCLMLADYHPLVVAHMAPTAAAVLQR